jgi:hypothetical protein
MGGIFRDSEIFREQNFVKKILYDSLAIFLDQRYPSLLVESFG